MDAVLVTLANLFLGLFALDTGLSLLDEALCAALGGHPLALVRNPVALLVLLASLPLWLLMLLSPRIPRGPFVPLALFSPLYVPLGLPLAYSAGWLTGEDAWQLSLLQAATLAWAAALLQARGGRPWLRLAALRGPAFSWWSSLRFAGGSAALVPTVALAFAFLVSASITRFTGGYLALRPGGFDLLERTFAKGDQRVRLVGMMHLGDQAAYGRLVRGFEGEDIAVLAEGVTDREGLLGGHLRYKEVAVKAGLDAQQDLLTYCPGLYVVHADVDLSDLHPQTVEILRHTERLLDFSHLDLAAVQDYLEWSSGLGALEQEIFWEDVIDRRNAEVLANLDAMLSQAWPEVVIPWGAGHMPDLDAAVRARGFTPEREVRHRLVAWGW
ncbi:MAG: hypothetical protein ABIO70_36445 [Pseudomonadota bacterium]